MATNKDYNLEKAIARTEQRLINQLIKRLQDESTMEKVRKGQIELWQIEQLNALDKFMQENRQYITNERAAELDKIIQTEIEESYQQGIEDTKVQISNAIKKGYEPTVEPTNAFTGTFAGVNDRAINALMHEVRNNMIAVEYAALRYAEDNYRRIIFDAQVYYQTGSSNLAQAIDMATKDFLKNGINCVEYKNGARVNIQSYSEMALRTASKRAYMQGEATMRDEFNIPLVIVTRRGDACPRCMEYVGKVFVDDVYGNGKPDGKHPLLSTAIAGGLYHPNCRDVHTTYFDGITTERPLPTEEEKQEANRVYQLEQHQRYLERNVRKYDRLYKGAVDPTNKEQYKRLHDQWQTKTRNFVNQHEELRRKHYRERAVTLDNAKKSN